MYGAKTKKTVIALDFDDTITKEPNFFRFMVENFKSSIDFYIVTYRSANSYDDLLREFEVLTEHKVVFTDTKAKRDKFYADIWIDDRPISITHDFTDYGFIASKTTKSLYLKSNKCILHNGTTHCHNELSDKELSKFKFCPFCSGEIIK